MNDSDISESERILIAEVARMLEPRLGTVVRSWAEAIPLAAPDDKLPESGDMLVAFAGEVVAGFLKTLAEGDPQRALEVYEEFSERFVGGRLSDPSLDHPLTIEDLSRSSGILREIIDGEIALAFGNDRDRGLMARFCYARLWSLANESLALIYARLYQRQVKRNERELIATRDAALEASRLKSAFVANMAHEIRTPLNVILGYADLMAERLGEINDEGGLQYAEPIRRAGRRLLDTIGAVLDLSRIESGAFELKPSTVKLAVIVERQVHDIGVLARKKGIDLVCQIDEPDAMVRFDEHCLSNTITNLLQNAIKFTERGTISVRVFRDRLGLLSLEVRDTGIGIDPAYLPHLFEPFSQESRASGGSHEGAGLGLALVKRYVEFNGAHIEVESTKHSGTVFIVTFPQEQANHAAG